MSAKRVSWNSSEFDTGNVIDSFFKPVFGSRWSPRIRQHAGNIEQGRIDLRLRAGAR